MALRRLLQGRIAIVIAHRLDGGRSVEQSTHEELLEAKGAY